MTQLIRPSQFILTYGPGAIMESPSGPVIIPDLGAMIGQLAKYGQSDLRPFEILDQRFTSLPIHPDLPGVEDWGILRIPSNAELKWKETRMVYPAKAFPNWCLCPMHSILYQASQGGCPHCPNLGRSAMDQKAGREAFRFVWACRNGHLDDVRWVDFVHLDGTGAKACDARHLEFIASGGPMESVRIRCPKCRKEAKLLDLYHKPWACTGRHPHRREPDEACQEKMQLQQRGAHALFQPEVLTSLTLEPIGADTFRLAKELLPTFGDILDHLKDNGEAFEDWPGERYAERFAKALTRRHPTRTPSVKETLLGDWDGLISLLKSLCGLAPADDRPRREVEFRRLLEASLRGAPTDRKARKGAPPLFEVPLDLVRRNVRWLGPPLMVAPVTRLREVAVQAGFRRMIGKAEERPALVSAGVQQKMADGYKTLFPGVDRYGEGLFFALEDGAILREDGRRWKAWLSRWEGKGRVPASNPFSYPRHPLEVWWHTLAHRLMRSLSLNAGYTSSSLRERTFFIPPGVGRPAAGGLLIYAVQSGGDGTLGGLTALAANLGAVLDDAVHDLAFCSNGLVCDEAAEEQEGAACYACLYASETSCEFRNRGLDRSLLVETLEENPEPS